MLTGNISSLLSRQLKTVHITKLDKISKNHSFRRSVGAFKMGGMIT